MCLPDRTLGLLFDTEIPAAVTFPQGARVNSVREQDSLVGDGYYPAFYHLLAFSSSSRPSWYGDSFPLRARTFGRTFRLLPLLPSPK